MKNLIINMSDKSITENKEDHPVLRNEHCQAACSHFSIEDDYMRTTDRVDQQEAPVLVQREAEDRPDQKNMGNRTPSTNCTDQCICNRENRGVPFSVRVCTQECP